MSNRKAIVSLGAGPQERLLGLAARSFRPYAKRHGYDLHLHTEGVDDSRPLPWSKVRLLQRLQDDYDLLLWLDADLVIVDQRVDLAAELDPARFLGLVEHEVGGGRFPNSGVMALQTGPACRAFLEDVWAQEDLVDHQWWENAAICRLLGYELEPVVRPGRADGAAHGRPAAARPALERDPRRADRAPAHPPLPRLSPPGARGLHAAGPDARRAFAFVECRFDG